MERTHRLLNWSSLPRSFASHPFSPPAHSGSLWLIPAISSTPITGIVLSDSGYSASGFRPIEVGEQIVEHLCQIAHDRDGAAILHASWRDDAQQPADLPLHAIARDDHTQIFERVAAIFCAYDDLHTFRFHHLRRNRWQETTALQHLHHLADALRVGVGELIAPQQLHNAVVIESFGREQIELPKHAHQRLDDDALIRVQVLTLVFGAPGDGLCGGSL